MLSTSSIRALSILIIFFFKSQSDNSNITSLYESASDVWLALFLLWFSLFGMSWNFFLIAGHGVLGKNTAVNRLLVMWW